MSHEIPDDELLRTRFGRLAREVDALVEAPAPAALDRSVGTVRRPAGAGPSPARVLLLTCLSALTVIAVGAAVTAGRPLSATVVPASGTTAPSSPTDAGAVPPSPGGSAPAPAPAPVPTRSGGGVAGSPAPRSGGGTAGGQRPDLPVVPGPVTGGPTPSGIAEPVPPTLPPGPAPRTPSVEVPPGRTVPAPALRSVTMFALQAQKSGCPRLAGYSRRVPQDGALVEALLETLGGPTAEERSGGASSMFSADRHLLAGVRVVNGIARVDLTADAAGLLTAKEGCRAAKVLEPLRGTVLQFGEVRDARFTIGGSEEAFYRGLLRQQVPPNQPSGDATSGGGVPKTGPADQVAPTG